MRLYWEIGKRAFQRQLAYRTANLAGLFTNAVFGYLRAVIMLALFETVTDVAGYDLPTAIAYSWATQAALMIIATEVPVRPDVVAQVAEQPGVQSARAIDLG